MKIKRKYFDIRMFLLSFGPFIVVNLINFAHGVEINWLVWTACVLVLLVVNLMFADLYHRARIEQANAEEETSSTDQS